MTRINYSQKKVMIIKNGIVLVLSFFLLVIYIWGLLMGMTVGFLPSLLYLNSCRRIDLKVRLQSGSGIQFVKIAL